jgi:ribosomal protein S7
VPRKGFIAKREVLADPIYNSVIVTKLINNIMLDGKKGVAQRIVYDASTSWLKRQVRSLWKRLTRRWITSCPCLK